MVEKGGGGDGKAVISGISPTILCRSYSRVLAITKSHTRDSAALGVIG